MSPTGLGARVRCRLFEWKAEGRLSWADVCDFQADVIGDTDEAVEQAIADVEFDDWWHGCPMRTARYRAIFDFLRPRRAA